VSAAELGIDAGQGLVDSDVHHTWPDGSQLLDYLPREWREYAEAGSPQLRPPTVMYPQIGGVNKRVDTFGPEGELPGSVRERMQTQLLDPFEVEAAILSYDFGNEPSHFNPFFSSAVASAANDWTIDTWLTDDEPRLFAGALCPSQLPEEAAKEIRRVGTHPRIVSVLLCSDGLGLPFGHPAYDPIYEAALEVGLPISIHVGNEVHRISHYTAGGVPSMRLEAHSLMLQPLQHYVTSMLVYGLFERYPELRVGIIEGGVSWVPWLLLRLDAVAPQLRRETPWLRREPSEYARDHLSFSTQPFDAGPNRDGLIELLAGVEGIERMLMFSSDYPHWDADDPLYLRRVLPEEWHGPVFGGNARGYYNLPPRPALATSA
jgi:uncharacterized protein